jgi:hypothetical protein
MELTEIRWEYVDWIHVAEDRGQWRTSVNAVMNSRVPWASKGTLLRIVII